MFCSYSSPRKWEPKRLPNKNYPKAWGVIGPSAFGKGAWGFESSSLAQFVFQSNSSHLSWQKQSYRSPQVPALGCPNNVHGVTTIGLQTSFVPYINKCVQLLHLSFHAACPIHSFSPQYASVFHNPPMVSG